MIAIIICEEFDNVAVGSSALEEYKRISEKH